MQCAASLLRCACQQPVVTSCQLSYQCLDCRCTSGAATLSMAATIAPLGSVDAIFFKSSFAHMHDQHEALWACCRMLRPGGHIVISHPLGRWECHQQ